MPYLTARSIAALASEVPPGDAVGLDQLGVVRVPLVPEISLYLATDAIVWWARIEAQAGSSLPAPYWASAWLGGQAVARYVLDHPWVVAGRRVLDLASGSGLVAIAAGMAGARTVAANDIDPHAVAAAAMNARLNGVEVDGVCADLLQGDGDGAEVVLAGDTFYDSEMADAVMGFLDRAGARGADVLMGDPGRSDLPRGRLEVVATYSTDAAAAFSDSGYDVVHVLRPRATRRGAALDLLPC